MTIMQITGVSLLILGTSFLCVLVWGVFTAWKYKLKLRSPIGLILWHIVAIVYISSGIILLL